MKYIYYNKSDSLKYLIISCISNVFYAIIICVLIMLATNLIVSATNSNTGKFSTYIVSGYSMEPNIYGGDAIIILDIGDNNYEIGDVITFNLSKNEKISSLIVTHRIIDIKYLNDGETVEYYITKGDNPYLTSTEQVENSQVKGKVLLRLIKFGEIINFVKSNIISSFLILFNIFALYSVLKMSFTKSKHNINQIKNK